MPVMYGQEGSGGRGGGGIKRGGVYRRGGDRKFPDFPGKGGFDGHCGGEQNRDNHRDGSSFSDKQFQETGEEMDMEEREENLATRKVRIYVGGLGEGVTRDDLCGTFCKMGVEIEAVDIIRTKGRSFAYINLSQHSADSLSKLFNTYNGCIWKGGRLRLEKAKEDYLVRLKREWDLDAQSANNTSATNVDINVNNTEPADKLKKGITSEKKQLRVFFPKLRKVKSLPFTGTGKHKYSFRRVEVPPLPTYFCDCEEHCGSLYSVEKQIARVEDQSSGMNKQEIELMNSVMHKLLEKKNISSATFNDLELTKEEDDTSEEINELQLDEIENTDDDMIINVVSRAKETIRPYQDSKSNKRQASVMHKLFEKENVSSHTCNNLESTKEEDDSNEEINDLQFDEIEGTDDDMIINVVSRAKETIRPYQDSKSNKRQASSDEPTNPKPKKKTRYDKENTESNKSAVASGAKNMEPKSSGELFGSSFSWSQKSSWKELIGDKSNNSITISNILPSTSSKKTKQRKSNSPNSKTKKSHDHQRDQLDRKVQETADTKMDSIEAQASKANSPSERLDCPRDQLDEKNELNSAQDKHEYQRDQLDEKVEAFTETQPNKTDLASEQAGRGSAWLHKSSWTQLVTSNTSSSFSITQIIPDLAFDKQEPAKPDCAVITNSIGNTVEQRESDSVFGASGLATGSDNGNASALTATRASLTRNMADVGTFSFKRSDESLKEWAKLKAALTRTGKRANKKK